MLQTAALLPLGPQVQTEVLVQAPEGPQERHLDPHREQGPHHAGSLQRVGPPAVPQPPADDLHTHTHTHTSGAPWVSYSQTAVMRQFCELMCQTLWLSQRFGTLTGYTF